MAVIQITGLYSCDFCDKSVVHMAKRRRLCLEKLYDLVRFSRTGCLIFTEGVSRFGKYESTRETLQQYKVLYFVTFSGFHVESGGK